MRQIEWPTLLVIAGCYLTWLMGITLVSTMWLPAGIVVTALAIALHTSLQHEIIHGHPFAVDYLNVAIIFPPLILCIPYLRFRDTHLAHHQDACLTDPYDDPETNYLDPMVWNGLSAPVRFLLEFNNTLFGRLLVGPLVAQVMFTISDFRAMRAGDARVVSGWLWHVPSVALVIWWVLVMSDMPFWAYALAAYIALSILKIRTFLEHQAKERVNERIVVIEDRGPLAFMFLNNNLHIVHHMHPSVPWYRLPGLYFSNRDKYLKRNRGYRYASYAEVFRRYMFRAKDQVPHPLWPRS